MRDFDYRNKVILITGAASGLGKLATEKFAAAGAQLAICDLSLDGVEGTAAPLREVGTEVLAMECDVTVSEHVDTFITSSIEQYGRLDVAINNAGVLHSMKRIDECDEALWDRTINVNLKGLFFCLKHELTQMSLQQHGVILNVASVAGLVGAPMLGPYAASKHGVIGLTRTAAAEYAGRGIRVNALCPGFTQTPMVDEVVEERGTTARKGMSGSNPMGRLGTAEEITDAMLWLCSEQNSFMNGQAIALDGGLSAT